MAEEVVVIGGEDVTPEVEVEVVHQGEEDPDHVLVRGVATVVEVVHEVPLDDPDLQENRLVVLEGQTVRHEDQEATVEVEVNRDHHSIKVDRGLDLVRIKELAYCFKNAISKTSTFSLEY